ncbi:MAG: hypothetical protein EOM15_12155, partial [Spirochaetia bacterium]|nr:hypothetical protein [Spirochaetia bacterium]
MRTSRKTVVLILAVFLLVSVSAFGSPNQQKIFSLSSDVYEAIEVLYVSQGLSLPSTTGPYSQAELSLMLQKIDVSKLKESLADVYAYVEKQLAVQPKIEGKGIGLSWNFDATLEGYYHTDTTNFLGREAWNYQAINQKPLLTVGLETWPNKNFYGYSEFSVGNTHTLENGFGTTALASNLIVLP